jgi:hypothetical protein
MFVNSDILGRFFHCGKTLAKRGLLTITDKIFLNNSCRKKVSEKVAKKIVHIFYSNTFSSISLTVFKIKVSKPARIVRPCAHIS